ncbi:MAG: carboxypeptidase-like regulatory domain-containing protein, partial [Planctomycetota bacterium]
MIQAEGYETLSHTLAVEGSGRRVEVVLLRPTRGWYGQVVDWEGKPVQGASIAGFWVEAPRPMAIVQEATATVSPLSRLEQLGYVGDEEAKEAWKPEKPADHAGGPPEPDPPQVRFFSGVGRVAARFSTNVEGWYYLPPLSGPVIGRLTLIATKTGGSSDVLRVSLPQDGLELPEIVIHRPWVLHGTVVDNAGYPVPGARILLQLADGWSPAWPPLVTDERGAFQFEAPLADLALAVEKSGYALQGTDLSKPESSDGMWEDLARIAPHGSDPALLFRAAYGGWKTLLPRARPCVRVESWQPEVLLTLAPLPALEVVVAVAGAPDRTIPGARVLARFGGHDAGEVEAFTDLLGSASVRTVDREWQPTVILVSAEGFHPRHFALSPGELRSPLRVALLPIEEEEGTGTGSPGSAEDVCAGLVVGPDGVPRSASVAIYSLRGRRSILWSGPCDEDGRFEFSRPRPNEMLLACALWEDDGVRFGVQQGPLAASLWPLAERLELRLESGTQMDLELHGLQAKVPYRIRWQVSAIRGLPPLAEGLLPVPEGARSPHGQRISVPSGWMLEALVEAASVDNVAEIDFFRGARRQLPFPSTRITWQNWAPVSRRATRLGSAWGGRMALVVGGRVSIHGTVANMPWLADPNSVHVAATGEAGTWIASIDGNGWFDVRDIPPGTYRLVLFSRRPGTTYALTDQGDAIGSVTAECTYRFNQVVIPWGDAGDAGDAGDRDLPAWWLTEAR